MTDLRKLAEGPDLLQLFADKLRIRKDQAEECECSFGDEDILAVAVEVLTECGCKPANASAAKDAEIARLEKLVYAPGIWSCPKCKFTLIQSNLNAADGTVTARDTPGDKCPNCDSPLWRVSWKQNAMENFDTACKLVDEAKSKDGREVNGD